MSHSVTRKLILLPAALLAAWLGIRYGLPILMPFLLGTLLALAAEPLVRFWQTRAKMPRAAATGIGMTMTLVLLALAVMILVALVVRELGALAGIVPDLEDTALEGLSLLEAWLLDLAAHTPQSISPLVTRSVEGLFSDGTALLDQVSTRLLGLASGIVSKLPDSVLGIGTWLLSCYMISAKLPAIRKWVGARIPKRWRENYLPMLKRLKGSVLGWLWAQCKLMVITFAVLGIGFFILQIPYALLWALVIAFLDALPVLGTGMVLVPWSLVCLLQGDTVRAVGLLGIYAAATLLRSVLEPRFVGKQLGLDPLVTLLAMYAGYRLFGFGGMILSPLLAVTVTQMLTTQKEP